MADRYSKIPWRYVDDTRPENTRKLVEWMLSLMTDEQIGELTSKMDEDWKEEKESHNHSAS